MLQPAACCRHREHVTADEPATSDVRDERIEMMQAKATKNILDVIDEVRGSLGGGLQGSQQAFYEELLASLPQFVAVGPQSAGNRAPLVR